MYTQEETLRSLSEVLLDCALGHLHFVSVAL